MSLLKVTGLNAIAVIIKIFSSIVLNKILAIYVGPSGFATIGQFQNFTSLVNSGAGGLISNGVVKYTAEYGDNYSKQVEIWRAAVSLTIFFAAIVSFLVFIFKTDLSILVLGTERYSNVFFWVGFGVIVNSIATFLLSVLNGKKEVKKYVLVNIFASLVNMVFVSFLAVFYRLEGALIALALNQSVILLFSFVACLREEWFSFGSFFGRVSSGYLKSLISYALMAITSAIAVPMSQIFIRNRVGDSFGWDAAGHWEAMIRISSVYLMIITTPLSVYYLPRLSEIKSKIELKREILKVIKLVLPVVSVFSFVIYVARDLIVVLLFDEKFMPMRDLFAWQMLGDTVKVCSWVFGFVLLGRAMVREFILTEILFSVSWVLWVYVFCSSFGAGGAQIGYFVNYVIHLFVMIYLVVVRVKFDEKN